MVAQHQLLLFVEVPQQAGDHDAQAAHLGVSKVAHLRSGDDTALAQRFTVDHSVIVPLHFMTPKMQVPVIPVFGPEAKLQPVFVDDAAAALTAALADPAKHGGKTYELTGPDVLTMGELNRMIAKAAGRSPAFIDLPDPVSGAIAALTGWLPLAPITSDQWKLLKAGNVSSGLPGLKALGVSARPLSLFLDRWMVQYREHGRFGEKASA